MTPMYQSCPRIRLLSSAGGIALVLCLSAFAASGKADDDWVSNHKPAPSTQPSATNGGATPLAGPAVDASSVTTDADPSKTFAAKGAKPESSEIQALLKSLNLSEDQKNKIKGIMMHVGADIRQWRKENQEKIRSLRVQIDFAKDAKDPDRLKDLMSQAREIFASRPNFQTYVDQIAALLTPEQKAKFTAGMGPIIKRIQDKRHHEMEHDNMTDTAPSTQPDKVEKPGEKPAMMMTDGSGKMMDGGKMDGTKMDGSKPSSTSKPAGKKTSDKLNL